VAMHRVSGGAEGEEVHLPSRTDVREKTLQTKIIKLLRSRGAWVMNVHGSPSQATGIPDLLVCYKGVFLAIEVKRPDRRSIEPTPLQAHNIAAIKKAGGQAYICWSTDQIEPILKRIDNQYAAGIWPWQKKEVS